ncbi:MAG TPA: RDD family protein [Solirubrobacter sp.]|nr:RDD family protein [Solirubrobacter sp.]
MTGYTSPPPPGAGGPPPATGAGLRLAGWWRRVAASIIDGLVIWGSAAYAVVHEPRLLLAWAPLALLYALRAHTLGRLLAGTRVVRPGGRLTAARAAFRELAKWVLWPLTLGLDVLWPLWDEQRRALHDFAAGTRVVRR